MKYFFKLTSLIFFSCSAFSQKPNAVIDARNYTFDLAVNDDNDTIDCIATITLAYIKDAEAFDLDLASVKSNGKGMKVISVVDNNQPIKFQHEKNILHLITAGKKGEQKTISISYRGVPSDGLIISKNKYRHRTFFSDNWPNRAQNWLACVDHPSDKASVDFIVKAPSHYQVIGNGVQVEESNIIDNNNSKLTHWREVIPISTKIMVIGIADFAVNYAGDVNCIPVYTWVYPEDKEKGFYDFALATEVLPYFIKNIGPYPFSKLANIQSKTIFGGMENASAIFYAESLVDGKRTAEPTIVHEIAHQWFGDMATEAEWSHLWLSEGFATYMTMLYMENKYGKDTLKSMMAADRKQVTQFAKTKQVAVVDSTVTDYMQLLNANSYQKGGWVLHMLRQELGDSAFWRGIRNYYEKYTGKNAVTRDLQKEMETVSGKDLGQFFKQWLFTPGQPVLSVSWKYDAAKKSVNIVIEQQQKTLFRFPIEVAMAGNGKELLLSKTIQIAEKQTILSIPVKSVPTGIQLDPQVKLLFEAVIVDSK